jgi:hypothetical protein
VQDHAAGQLHIEMALTDGALGRLAHGGKRRHQDVVERLAVGKILLESLGARAQRVIRQLFEFLLQRVDGVHPRLVLADTAIVRGTKKLAGDRADHVTSLISSPGRLTAPAASMAEMRHFPAIAMEWRASAGPVVET